MPAVYDLDHFYGEDVGLTPSGDIALVSGSQLTIQRVIRRLMTAPTTTSQSDYPADPTLGAGIGSNIGDPNPDSRGMGAAILSQLFLEPTVSKTPAPTVLVTPLPAGAGAVINIAYTDTSGTPQNFNFNLTP